MLTDLTDRDLDSLDWPPAVPIVKSRLTRSEHEAWDWLSGALPELAEASLARLEIAGPHRWRALGLVDAARNSQYDALLAAVRQAPPPAPVAAAALTGRGFHGNRGRIWHAARGNLHLSCAAPLNVPVSEGARALPAIAAVAVGDALAACAPGLDPRIKWVNDLLLDGAKFGGVLTSTQSQGERLVAAVLGVGINLTAAPPVPPTVFVPRVTHLQAHPAAAAVTYGGLLQALLEALAARLDELARVGADPAVAAYRERCGDIGRRVRVWAEGAPDAADAAALPRPVAAGKVLALGDDLALYVQGAAAPLHGGRLAHDEPGPAISGAGTGW